MLRCCSKFASSRNSLFFLCFREEFCLSKAAMSHGGHRSNRGRGRYWHEGTQRKHQERHDREDNWQARNEQGWNDGYEQGWNGGYGCQAEQHHGYGGNRGRQRFDRPSSSRSREDFIPLSSGNQDERPPSQKERPPPGLKGREIGMWYAKRSQARKEREQKANRSTVTMDSTREQNIRRLLNNLQEIEGRSQSSQQSDFSSSRARGRGGASGMQRQTATGGAASLNDETLDQGSASSTSSSSSSFPASSSSSSTTFVYQESQMSFPEPPKQARLSEEPPDSWEALDSDGSDNDVQIVAETVKQEVVIDLDNYDEEGNELPSVAGVVQYMKSHGDYPYVGDEPDADFQTTVPDPANSALDEEMKEKMTKLMNNPQFVKMLDFRKKLPSYGMKETIVSAVNSSQVLVISGETGCGKTTQVPQFILDSYIENGTGSQCRIICTQPRRISAISVAERVAAERCERVDDSRSSAVGYQIRLETKRPRNQGSILFCTTGIVLKFLEGDPYLKRATHVIIDEIHERDLQSDFLMIILKDLLPQRPDLKVILMSATLNAEMFSKYFNNCQMLNIPGYTFPVKEYLLEDAIEMSGYMPDASHNQFSRQRRGRGRKKPEEMMEEQDYQVWCRNLRGEYSSRTIDVLENFDFTQIDLNLIHHLINHICTHMEDGAILVFVPGWEEIKKLHEMLQATARSGSLRVIPLHSLMPTVNQREVFDRPPPGIRKIVIATNIAETSITIDDVVFVIDCGKIKVKGFNPEMNLTSLEPQWVSQANARQRRGRAGRVQPGHCFHLYTKFRGDQLQDYLPPEMLRTRLEELCLQIKLLKLGRIIPFISKAMQHPSVEAITHAVETLIELKALDADENLLPLGYHLARLPVEPHTGKMILFGAMFCCLDPILTVAASLSFKDAFTIPLGKEAMADRARIKLAGDSKSDHIMLINAYKGWERSLSNGNSHNYCWENFLSVSTLMMLKDMKRQLAELLYDTGFVASKNPKDSQANINSGNLGLIRAVLCAGLYPNVAQITKVPRPNMAKHKSILMSTKDNNKVAAHPKSVNKNGTFFESKWMVFYHKLKTSKIYIHDCTMVSPYPLLFFGGEIKMLREDNVDLVSVDDWVKFKAASSTAQLVKDLRDQLDKLLTRKITHPGPTSWDRSDTEGALMVAIADLITMEDLGNSVKGEKSGGTIGVRS